MKGIFSVFYLLLVTNWVHAADISGRLVQLQKAYPEMIISVSPEKITWVDGTQMPVSDGQLNKTTQQTLDRPALYDQLNHVAYPKGVQYRVNGDPGRVRYTAFFQKMYGSSAKEVETKLVMIYWMPKVFQKKYPLRVTTVNGVNVKLQRVSAKLEQMVAQYPAYQKFLAQPGSTFNWRVIANTQRMSPHSFGMTIDINPIYSHYWQWELEKAGIAVSEDTPLDYKNTIPMEIVQIFEEEGFIWGGKWYHYDTMHFEYRPEML